MAKVLKFSLVLLLAALVFVCLSHDFDDQQKTVLPILVAKTGAESEVERSTPKEDKKNSIKTKLYPKILASAGEVDTYWIVAKAESGRVCLAKVENRVVVEDYRFKANEASISAVSILSDQTSPVFFKADDFFSKREVTVGALGSVDVNIVTEELTLSEVEVRVSISKKEAIALRQFYEELVVLIRNSEIAFSNDIVNNFSTWIRSPSRKVQLKSGKRFQIENLFTPASFEIEINKEGFLPCRAYVQLTTEKPNATVESKLKRGAVLQGQLFGLKEPIDGGFLEVRRIRESKGLVGIKGLAKIPCRRDGFFQVGPLKPGRYHLIFTGCSSEIDTQFFASREIDVTSSGFDFGRIYCLGERLIGKVIDSENNPVPFQKVKIYGAGMFKLLLLGGELKTDKDGVFAVYLPKAVEVDLTIDAQDLPKSKEATPREIRVGANGGDPVFRIVNRKQSVVSFRYHCDPTLEDVNGYRLLLWDRSKKLRLSLSFLRRIGDKSIKFEKDLADREIPDECWVFIVDRQSYIVSSQRLTKSQLQNNPLIEMRGIDPSITSKVTFSLNGVAEWPAVFLTFLNGGLGDVLLIQRVTRERPTVYFPVGFDIQAASRGFLINGKDFFRFTPASGHVALTLRKKAK